ncbi:Alcohol dehydrogenase superfamily zinc-containing [Macrophomina phaseolina MS6]|uniref:Probable quinone oxidoreductase n=1 Tax=Macrophomina phaseolina (strain MS6) TaxID=1126212 RepID=K2SIN9_MACPH|nr:Alcohol dehydrogenase superfamily zinc-containing [Macrophomina phaseolina MS6]
MASTSLPSTMKGVIIEKTGGTEVLQYKTDLPVPQPKAGEVLVKNDFIGINYIDTYFRTGLYPAPSFPYILGREAAGLIVATGSDGELHGLKTGDRIAWMGQGAYAEYTAIPVSHATKVPEGVSSDVAAAALLQGLTALTLIREAHPVKKGDWVLVHAAAGGVGLWLCQLLKAVGARTIGTASTEEKIELAKKNGAEVLINYSKDDVVEKVKEVTGGQGVAAVFDGVGKATFDISLESVARKGSLISFGNASGAVPPVTIAYVNLSPLPPPFSCYQWRWEHLLKVDCHSRLSAKNVKLLRPTLFNYLATREEFNHYTKELFQFIEKDGIDVRIHEVYPLAEVARAHQDLEGRKTTGKLLLKP